MPANKKMGRVIITPDSYVHIVLKDRKSYKCTPNCLMYLLKDPVAFMDEAPRLFVNTTSEVNPSYEDLEDIVGLTLACFYEDRRFECFFPELFVELFRQMSLSTDFGLGFNAYINKEEVPDLKSMYLKVFLNAVKKMPSDTFIENTSLDPDDYLHMLKELTNAFALGKAFHEGSGVLEVPSDAPTVISGNETTKNSSPTITDPIMKATGKVTVAEYCAHNNISRNTVNDQIRHKRLKTAERNAANIWVLDINDKPTDGRKDRVNPPKNDSGQKVIRCPKNPSYEELQTYIKGRGLFTDKVRPFIRSREEVKFYEDNYYHEVFWEDINQAGLIIDINPDYICPLTGMSNRALIKAGKSPAVPGSDGEVFHLHHIGQLSNSPFAIIPQSIHNGKGTSSFLHLGSTSDDLHGKEFDERRRKFWAKYMEMYDTYLDFNKIPYLNDKKGRNGRREY